MNSIKNKKQNYYNKIKLWPKSIRVTVGMFLLVFGILGFLPVVGFWMIPLGLMVLAIDFPIAQRYLTKVKYQFRKIKRRWKKKKG